MARLLFYVTVIFAVALCIVLSLLVYLAFTDDEDEEDEEPYEDDGWK